MYQLKDDKSKKLEKEFNNLYPFDEDEIEDPNTQQNPFAGFN